MCFWHIIEAIGKVAGVLLSIVSIFGVIAGVYMAYDYISKIKERQYESIFNFYSRFHMYLLEFKIKIATPDKSVLLLKYNKNCLGSANNITIPDESEVDVFKGFIITFISFLKDTDNQVPLSSSILEHCNNLKKVLIALTMLGKNTPYEKFDNNSPVTKEHAEIVKLINDLLDKIEKKQLKIATEIEEKEDKKP